MTICPRIWWSSPVYITFVCGDYLSQSVVVICCIYNVCLYGDYLSQSVVVICCIYNVCLWWLFVSECGGNLTEPAGSIASPNWPRDYAHHETCVWNITTTKYKVLHLHFTHFDIGLQSTDPCSEEVCSILISCLSNNKSYSSTF